MGRLLAIFLCTSFFAGCMSKKEMELMVEGLAERKATAAALIDKRDFKTESLLQIQDYFFELAERIHLMKVDEKAGALIKKLARKKGPEYFSDQFILPKRTWIKLEAYCRSESRYSCSFEIQQYPAIISTLTSQLGPELASELSQASGF